MLSNYLRDYKLLSNFKTSGVCDFQLFEHAVVSMCHCENHQHVCIEELTLLIMLFIIVTCELHFFKLCILF